MAALAGAVSAAAPSGNGVADHALAGGFALVVAAAGATAKRWTWFVVAGVALALADGGIGVGCGAAALTLALASTGPVRPSPAVGAAVGGVSAVALLRATDLGFHGASALAVGAAVAPVLVSGYRFAGRRTRRRVRGAAVAAAVALAVVIAGYAAAVGAARAPAERGIERLEQGIAAARAGDDARAARHLEAAADAFDRAEDSLGAWWAAPARVVPVLGHNARAADVMASAARAVAHQSAAAAAQADTDTLTVQGGRLDLARVQALEPPLSAVQRTVDQAAADLARADMPWLVSPLADRLDRVRTEIADAQPDVDLAADATRVLPAIFGGKGTTRWFVAFVTPVEARGRTGFMGNYAELTATDGKVEMTRFGRASELEAAGTPGSARTLSGPADYLAHWSRFAPASTWRNVTMSPDFPSIGQVIAELYPQSGGHPVDGVIGVDPVGLAALLRFTGPIEVPGVVEPLTAETAAQFLLRDQYLLLEDTPERIDALESLARRTFDRLTTGNLPGPRDVADALGGAVDGGHLHLYSRHADQQRLFERIGVDGALSPVEGDAVAVVTNNASGNKIDLFLQRTIDYAVRWRPATGDLTATLTVRLTNDAPDVGLPTNVIGSPLRGSRAPPSGTNRTYLSIYSPWSLQAATLDGRAIVLEQQRELGRNAYSVFVDVPPSGGQRTVSLELAGRLGDADVYDLSVASQPLVQADRLNLSVAVAGAADIEADDPLTVEGRTASVSNALSSERNIYRLEADS